jgi:hypothetical protein
MPTTVWQWYKKRYTCSAFSTFEQAQVIYNVERVLDREIEAEDPV